MKRENNDNWLICIRIGIAVNESINFISYNLICSKHLKGNETSLKFMPLEEAAEQAMDVLEILVEERSKYFNKTSANLCRSYIGTCFYYGNEVK